MQVGAERSGERKEGKRNEGHKPLAHEAGTQGKKTGDGMTDVQGVEGDNARGPATP